MTADVDMVQVAALLHRSDSWFRRHWRTLRHPQTGEPFPRPFVGGEPGGRPWWRRAAVEAWKDGAPAAGDTAGYPAQRAAIIATANDPAPRKRTDQVSALVAFAGG